MKAKRENKYEYLEYNSRRRFVAAAEPGLKLDNSLNLAHFLKYIFAVLDIDIFQKYYYY